ANDIDARVEGDDDAWGYNLGVIFQPVPETTLGLTYRSKVNYTLTGDFRAYTQDGMELANQRESASLNLTTPETINLSITQQMTDRLKLMAGASWVRWSRFEQIDVETPSGRIPVEEQNYSNAWAVAL